jgi:hypothetical protein
MTCAPQQGTCESRYAPTFQGRMGDVITLTGSSSPGGEGPRENEQSQQGTEITLGSGAERSLGYRCGTIGGSSVSVGADGTAVVVTVSQEDFASLPISPLVAHAGPAEGGVDWLPVNMDLVLYTDPELQTLDTELLGAPVAIRATPVRYEWDLGDGSTISTRKPGAPWPDKTLVHRYQGEGWYAVVLTTTFAGQFSTDGGATWQDIDGTVEVTSDPVDVYSRSLESRLVGPDAPDVDWNVPEKSPENQGPQNPRATHRDV